MEPIDAYNTMFFKWFKIIQKLTGVPVYDTENFKLKFTAYTVVGACSCFFVFCTYTAIFYELHIKLQSLTVVGMAFQVNFLNKIVKMLHSYEFYLFSGYIKNLCNDC